MADELNRVLEQRTIPEPASNLAERIVAAARPRPVQKGFDIGAWMEGFAQGFALPRPAMVMTLALLVGVILGLYVEESYAVEEEDLSLFIAESFQDEDWS